MTEEKFDKLMLNMIVNDADFHSRLCQELNFNEEVKKYIGFSREEMEEKLTHKLYKVVICGETIWTGKGGFINTILKTQELR